MSGERVPDPKTAYRVGSALRSLGAETHGAVALLAAGHIVPAMRFVRECALVDPQIAIALCNELPLVLGEFDEVDVEPIEYFAADGTWRTYKRQSMTPEQRSGEVAEMLRRHADDVDIAFEESLQRVTQHKTRRRRADDVPTLDALPTRLRKAREKTALDLMVGSAHEAADYYVYRAWVVASGAIASVEVLQSDMDPREMEARAFGLMSEFVYYLTHSANALSPGKGR